MKGGDDDPFKFYKIIGQRGESKAILCWVKSLDEALKLRLLIYFLHISLERERGRESSMWFDMEAENIKEQRCMNKQ